MCRRFGFQGGLKSTRPKCIHLFSGGARCRQVHPEGARCIQGYDRCIFFFQRTKKSQVYLLGVARCISRFSCGGWLPFNVLGGGAHFLLWTLTWPRIWERLATVQTKWKVKFRPYLMIFYYLQVWPVAPASLRTISKSHNFLKNPKGGPFYVKKNFVSDSTQIPSP